MDAAIIISIIIAVVSLLLVPFCMFYCKKCALSAIENVGSDDNGRTDRDLNIIENIDENTNGYNFGMDENDRHLSADDRKQRRKRELNVLKRVVIKRIPKSYMSNRIKPKEEEEKQTTNNNKENSNDLENQNKSSPSSPSSSKNNPHSSQPNKIMKPNTFFHNLPTILQNSKHKAVAQKWKNYLKEQDDVKTCGICLDNYVGGDEVCLSINEHCDHIFHKRCILSWLLSHDDCPNCRSLFLTPAV